MSKEKTVIYESTRCREYIITVNIEWSYDPDFGADADGNRGMATWFLEEFEITDIESIKTGNDIPVSRLSQDYLDKIYDTIYDKVID